MKAQFIYEKFTDESDPIHDMGIGLRHKIKEWLNNYNVINYVINNDMQIDIIGDFDININRHNNIEKFPNYIKFNRVSGNVTLQNLGLTSLIGCPKYVGGFFSCHENELTSLEGGPIKVLY